VTLAPSLPHHIPPATPWSLRRIFRRSRGGTMENDTPVPPEDSGGESIFVSDTVNTEALKPRTFTGVKCIVHSSSQIDVTNHDDASTPAVKIAPSYTVITMANHLEWESYQVSVSAVMHAITRDVPHREAVDHPDIASSVTTVARFATDFGLTHWEAARRPPISLWCTQHVIHERRGKQPTGGRYRHGQQQDRGLTRHIGARVPHRWRRDLQQRLAVIKMT
jgi:hypothetical protein